MPTPIEIGIPPEEFGDAVMVIEYLTCFSALFDVQEEFEGGITMGKKVVYDSNLIL